MEINVNNGWYRLALYGTFFNKDKIKSNLCPFMRKVTIGTTLAFILYPSILAILLLSLAAPWYQAITALYYNDMAYWFVTADPFFHIGFILYWMSIITASIIGLIMLFTSNNFQNTYKNMLRGTLSTLDKGATAVGLEPVAVWIKAVHNKVCIPIKFK